MRLTHPLVIANLKFPVETKHRCFPELYRHALLKRAILQSKYGDIRAALQDVAEYLATLAPLSWRHEENRLGRLYFKALSHSMPEQ